MKQNQQNYDHLQLRNGNYSSKSKSNNKSTKCIRIAVASLVLTTLLLYYRALSFTSSSADTSNSTTTDKCDIFSGEWVRDYAAMYYTHKTCSAIHEHQNCLKYGRPDTDFLKWRWKPNACDMPAFSPAGFFQLVRGKKMAFVGDSVARNQMQSLLCLLSSVETPIDMSYTKDNNFKRYKYKSYNFLLASFWSPFLVKAEEGNLKGIGMHNLFLDEYDNNWTWQAAEFDYLIISAGHWFDRPLIYHEQGKPLGGHYLKNITELGMYFAYRRAFRTAFKAVRAINRLKNYKGVTYLRTFAPSHFEGGGWNEGGNCVRTKPFRSDEVAMEGMNLELYKTQLEEFNAAAEEGRARGMRFRLLNTTHAMLMRPDGHPSKYGHLPNDKVKMYNDCVHWCLPGPVDTWNFFLFELLKSERLREAQEQQRRRAEG